MNRAKVKISDEQEASEAAKRAELSAWRRPTVSTISVRLTLNAGSTATDGNGTPGSL